jgi:hypothetical protein
MSNAPATRAGKKNGNDPSNLLNPTSLSFNAMKITASTAQIYVQPTPTMENDFG